MEGWMDGRTDGSMDGRLGVRMDDRMDGGMDRRMAMRMYGRMDGLIGCPAMGCYMLIVNAASCIGTIVFNGGLTTSTSLITCKVQLMGFAGSFCYPVLEPIVNN